MGIYCYGLPMTDYTKLCGKCSWPISFCQCDPKDYPTPEDWAIVQAFRREMLPECFSEFMLKHVAIHDEEGYLRCYPIDEITETRGL